MADLRPDLEAVFEAFGEDATVIIPGGEPVATQAIKQEAYSERFPGDPGNHSLTKGRPRLSLRLDHLGVDDVPYGTQIVIGAATWHVEATDVLDDQVAHVIARKGPPWPVA